MLKTWIGKEMAAASANAGQEEDRIYQYGNGAGNAMLEKERV
jgi:hypothetical protein